MPPTIAQPLPECPGCGQPVARSTADRTGGVCTPCLPHFPAARQAAARHEDLRVLQRQAARMRARRG